MQLINAENSKISGLSIIPTDSETVLTYRCDATAVYGMGERFDSVNRINQTTRIRIVEKFTQQGEDTYFPLPFFWADDGHGVFVETDHEVIFNLRENEFKIECADPDCSVHFFYGTPRQIVSQFITLTGEAVLPPDWAFGVWVSANRWNRQADIDEQLALIEKYRYPATVLVIEAWSDEATFYIWNGAAYTPQPGSGAFRSEDFQFGAAWPDPQGMIDRLHEKGIKLVLWQIPALKELEAGRSVPQHAADIAFALKNGLVAVNDDEARTPYRIPRQWFIGSYLPDFTNPALVNWWNEKRRYLVEMGVDGFKTDGGEFVHDLSIRFADGSSGESMRNRYAVAYEKSYHALAAKERVLFSRAGYTGAQTASLHWAGDQLSTFSEMRAVLTAGLSLGLSGVPFWGFDVGGFAGPIPTAELYLRATALAVFSPIMQWHSEMVEGQYGAGSDGDANNDRSPWNIARRTNDPFVCETATFFANLRMNLLPEIINQARIAQRDHLPMMRHLVFDYPDDPEVMHCDDQFLLGELLVAPILTEGVNGRTIYLPEGDWIDFWSGKSYPGKIRVAVEAELNRIPVFLRHGGAVLLNLADDQTLGSPVGNRVGDYPELTLLTGGSQASYVYDDKNGRSLRLTDGKLTSDLLSRLTVRNLEGMKML